MIRWFLKRGARRFGARYGYDVGYMEHVADISLSAGLRLAALQLYTQFYGPEAARDIRAGAVLGSTLDGDCGPCAQLVVDMAIEAGVPAAHLAHCLKGEAQRAGEVGLGFRFARAAIANGPELEALRAEIEQLHGGEAVIAAAFAASGGRIYPVLKRGLGFGQSCARVAFDDEAVRIARQT